MTWRILLCIVCLFANAATSGQQTERMAIVGMLMVVVEAEDPLVEALRQGLKKLGYVEGQNYTLEFRSAKGRLDRLPSLAGNWCS